MGSTDRCHGWTGTRVGLLTQLRGCKPVGLRAVG